MKELASSQKDRSKKGTVDEAIKPLLDAINRCDCFYTTSSCAGRIDLFHEPKSGKKHEGEWLFMTHEQADAEEVQKAAQPVTEGTLWFRMEGAILHVCASSLEAANDFLQLCRVAGWKHSGITGISPRIMIEAITSERIDAPLSVRGKLITETLSPCVDIANKKLERTRKKILKLQEAVYGYQR